MRLRLVGPSAEESQSSESARCERKFACELRRCSDSEGGKDVWFVERLACRARP